MRVVLHQVDEEGAADVPLDVGEEGIQLGRGPTLRIDATSISREGNQYLSQSLNKTSRQTHLVSDYQWLKMRTAGKCQFL